MGLLSRICKEENICICNADEADDFDGGCAFEIDGEKYILLGKDVQNYERQFVVAHEVAHHILGHIRKRSSILPPEKSEMEADIFASVLVASLLLKEYFDEPTAKAEPRTPHKIGNG